MQRAADNVRWLVEALTADHQLPSSNPVIPRVGGPQHHGATAVIERRPARLLASCRAYQHFT